MGLSAARRARCGDRWRHVRDLSHRLIFTSVTFNPLFVEEMTKAVLEAESEGAARRAVGKVPSPTFAVPESMHR
jgi:hypothetical protein